jgi:hypothetical protein
MPRPTTHTRIEIDSLRYLKTVAGRTETSVVRLLRDIVALAKIYDPRFQVETNGEKTQATARR